MDLWIESLVERPRASTRRSVAIGNFDGVHLGHARLLRVCVDEGRRRGLVPTALTFDPHPGSVVSHRGAPPVISTLTSRRRRLAEIGIEDLAHFRFDLTTARLTPAEFVDQALVDGVHCGCVVVGEGFRFGAGREGDVATLRTLSEGRFDTLEVPTLEEGGERVSSSRIRDALLEGNLREAERFLGRPYEIEGLVVHGDHRGRLIGFPTANIDLEGVSALRLGVYAADGFIDGESARRAAVNLGLRPTFEGSEPRLEAHFPGFNGDLYGRTVRLVFLARLRDEGRFDSMEDLKAQLREDVRRVQAAAGSGAS
ncbi:MAG: riboflavin biosynthesis protein RibF [Vicinamibacteria bacterium]|nr:riboflavin biosynthesis protein RibF [Vicinamibacteria bacterium]